ncbi:Mob1/phocein [Ilyonectria robusta]|uniref:Mob1/phocein n=1 Tax=Ilyonectria robusta TaxID=1079257 RepID=UPI001E8E21AB|nr:Mob1/phocein [Ilyonectria robusta]KAH8714439.1 Mob1/phocein [Ilyonectria robusta]
MSNLFSGINARMRGSSSKVAAPNKSSTPTADGPRKSHDTQSSTSSAPKVSLSKSSSFSESVGVMAPQSLDLPRPIPLWLNPAHTKHIVKGNFMTLSARPKTVEQGEWVAHQVVEHYRNLLNFVRIVLEKEEDGTSICTSRSCPKMSAGQNHSFTWLNKNHEPVELPAAEYMGLVQRWISGKVDDVAMFPTDPSGISFAFHPEYSNSSQLPQHGNGDWLGMSSGFPKQFAGTCQLMFRQIFRVYAHLYWSHFTQPYYHLNLEKQLNSCFSHFILTATTLDMLQPNDLEPMQLLIDLWAADGTFPPESRPYSYANVERGKYILSLSTAI